MRDFTAPILILSGALIFAMGMMIGENNERSRYADDLEAMSDTLEVIVTRYHQLHARCDSIGLGQMTTFQY